MSRCSSGEAVVKPEVVSSVRRAGMRSGVVRMRRRVL